jgi:ATP-dependent RNA helicase SUPV3L1/SUV3
VSLPACDFPKGYLAAIGYRRAGRLALRLDILERIAAHAWRLGKNGSFAIDSRLQSLAGCGANDMDAVLAEIGFHKDGEQFSFRRKNKTKTKQAKKTKVIKKVKYNPHSPFAKLKELALP